MSVKTLGLPVSSTICEDKRKRWAKVGRSSSTRLNRLINFPVFAFLLLMALLFLFSSQLSRLSAPRSMLESGKSIDRAAVEKATLINSHAVGLFPDPVGIKVSVSDQRVDSSVDASLNEIMRNTRVVPSYPKDHVHSRFNVNMIYETRRAANHATRRSNSHPVGFFLGLAHQFGAFMSRLQTISAADRFVQKEAVVTQTNGRPRKEMRINQRRVRSRMTSPFRPARSVLLRARARKSREFAFR